jgi:hypothetical protein
LLIHGGCFFRKSETDKEAKLYYEPPDRLIDDYTAMIEVEEVDWAWSELGFSFSDFHSITVNPVILLAQGPDQKMADKIYQGLTLWVEESDLQLSDSGDLLCEVAIVELNLERSFFNKVNIFDESTDHYLLQIELIITDTKRHYPLLKIRHGAVAPKKNLLLHRVMVGLISYFESHS